MKLPLAYYGNPILRKKGAKVEAIDDALRQLIKDMEETMFAHDGVGIAAPQVSKSLALFIVNNQERVGPNEWAYTETLVFINPKIISHSKETNPRGEGCLSIPGLYGEISRPNAIVVEATDIDGNRFTKEYTGYLARIILHENDHINGVLFIDRLKGKAREDLEQGLRAIKKKYTEND